MAKKEISLSIYDDGVGQNKIIGPFKNEKKADEWIHNVIDKNLKRVVYKIWKGHWISSSGKKCQHKHRIDGPAVIGTNGEFAWYLNGVYHREECSEPAVYDCFRKRFWYKHGRHHRVNGPAIIFANGWEQWMQNDEKHRIDGPAVIDNRSRREPRKEQRLGWWYRGIQCHNFDSWAYYSGLSGEEKLLYKFRFYGEE